MNKRIKNIKGGVMILMAIVLPVFLGFTCLVIDSWNLYLVRNKMQIATDSAALAAATSLNKVTAGNSATAITVAKTATGVNGFTHGTNSVTVTVTIPPGNPFGTSPSYATNSNFARVQISQPVTLYFGSIIGIPTMTVTTNAVGGPTSTNLSVATLAPSGAGSFSVVGSSSITTIGGALGINSNSSTAMTIVGSATINTSSVNIVGNYSNVGGTINATVNTGATAGADPFSAFTLPTFSSCTFTNYSYVGSGSVTLSPGTYCKGISITGSPTVTLNPGLYILYGGGLKIVGSPNITGTGVTIYNTGTASGTYAYGSLNLVGSGNITLSAPTSGTYQGMLFMQDRSNTNSASFVGSASSYFAGNLYLPAASVTITGSGTMSQPVGVLVAKNVSITGSGNLKFSTQYGGGGGVGVSLYE